MNTSLRVPRLSRITTYTVLIVIAFLISMPLVWMILTSLKKDIEYMSYPPTVLPQEVMWSNYEEAVTRFSFMQFASNSLSLALIYSVLAVTTSAMAGFAFSRFSDSPGSAGLFRIIIALLIVPATVTMIPTYVLFAKLNLVGTYWPWVLWGLGANALFIFLFRQFFASFPKELEEAAEVDGAGPFRIFWQIFLPNCKPVLATSFIFAFSWVWSDYIGPVMYLKSQNTTLAVKVATGFVTPQGNTLVPLTMAAAVLYSLPLVILFFIGQKFILKGVVTSGLKG